MSKVVIVESPAKAKTINKYLGSDYHVLASFGHVRDLPAKDGSVMPDRDFEMLWEVQGDKEKRIKEIAKALKGADSLILATDPDREGEAISWHLTEELNQRKAIKGVPVQRVVFNEITKRAVQEAMANPRALNTELVDAYLARRALDYLVGFTLSPVLWRKLPGSKSAGRVQSVALRLICERESEIEAFRPQEYWTVDVGLANPAGQAFASRLVSLDGKKLGKFDLSSEADAHAARDAILARQFAVASVEKKQVRRHPQAPFTTSTLQQEASRKLGFGATRTMRTAQRLYEGIDIGGETVGLITYMRTDGVQISQEAIADIRGLIGQDFGQRYLPSQPRVYSTKAKNAQEAHEAIRPTDISRKPQDLSGHLDDDQRRLYELVWKRAVASQMESAVLDQVTADITSPDGKVGLRATGSTLVFDGFYALYQEGVDDADDEDGEGRRLPALTKGDDLKRGEVKPEQHFTQPPPRYSEASLVKKLEELGIGRPSTYASILQVLQDRDYVRLEKRRFLPEDRGRIVTTFLTAFFERYVEYGFTAALEDQLDDISGGRADWKAVLRQFWKDFTGSGELVGMKEAIGALNDNLGRVGEVLDKIDTILGPHFFPPDGGAEARACPACPDRSQPGRLSLKLGKFGGFIGCSNYPNCRYTRELSQTGEGDGAQAGDAAAAGPILLGSDPVTQLPVTLRKGPYGHYIQLGPAEEAPPPPPANDDNGAPATKGKRKKAEPAEKPKRVSLPKGTAPADVTLDLALQLLSLPREVGKHPETGKTISAGIGRFGPYLRHDGGYVSLKEDDVLTVGMNRAVELIAQGKQGGRSAPAGTPIGNHPADNEPVTVHSGRYGPYVKHGRMIASLPKGREAEGFSLDEAVQLLAEKGKAPGSGRKGSAAKSAAGKSNAGKSGTKAKSAAASSSGTKKTAAKTGGTKTTGRAATTRKKAASGD